MESKNLPDVHINRQLPPDIMRRAAHGIAYIAHPLRLRILEFLDVHGRASVSQIATATNADPTIVSQALRKMRDAHLVTPHRRGIFIYYEIGAEYPASIFGCLRKLFGIMTDQLNFMRDDYRQILPIDYTTMAAGRIRDFANYDKMRILEYLLYRGPSCVGDIVAATGMSQAAASQYLRRLADDDFVVSRRNGRFIIYEITAGVHKTTIGCIHRRYDRVGNQF